MIFELLATFAAAFGAAGLVLVLNRVLGGRLPRWAMPVAAGAAMLAYAIWSEYSWDARTALGMPEGLTVVETVEEGIFYKPWTYLVPQVTRLVAADLGTMRTNPNAPTIRLVDLYFFARWKPPAKIPQLIDCENGARADVTDAALEDPSKADWVSLETARNVSEVICSQ